MSVVSISEMWQGRGSDGGGIGDTSARRQWRVRTNAKSDSWQAIAAVGVANGYFPNLYDPHPENVFLTARRLKIENQADSPFHWIATAEYSSTPVRDKDQQRQLHPDPCDRPADTEWNTTIYQQAVERDRNGKAVLNSAGDRPERAPQKDASHWVCTVTKNLRTVPVWLLDYNDCPINDDDFEVGGVPVEEGKARLYELRIGKKQVENGFDFYPVSMTIEFRKEGWVDPMLDEGFRKKETDEEGNVTRTHISLPDDNGELTKVSSPVPLDGNGQPLENPTVDNAVFIDFEFYEPKDFGALPLE